MLLKDWLPPPHLPLPAVGIPVASAVLGTVAGYAKAAEAAWVCSFWLLASFEVRAFNLRA